MRRSSIAEMVYGSAACFWSRGLLLYSQISAIKNKKFYGHIVGAQFSARIRSCFTPGTGLLQNLGFITRVGVRAKAAVSFVLVRLDRGDRIWAHLLGLASAFLLFAAMPGYLGWWPLLFFSLIPLLAVALYCPARLAFQAGFLSGFVYHILTLHWIVLVLGRYGGLPTPVGFGAMLLLSAYMGLYTGLFCVLLSFLSGRWQRRERSIASLIWTAPVLWIGLEYLRGMLFTGLPWLDIGYGLYREPMLMQSADLGGHALVGFALVLANGIAFAMLARTRSAECGDQHNRRRPLLLASCLLFFLFGYSYVRYQALPSLYGHGPEARVAVVQGNIRQDEKWSRAKKQETVAIYTRLSRRALAGQATDLLVWPETALPFYPQQDPLVREVQQLVRQEKVYLLTGAPTYRPHRDGPDDKPQYRYYNSALLFGPDGKVVDGYAKQHLVPFGEYVPLKKLLFFLAPLVENSGDFSPGKSARPLVLGDRLRLGILICFESIFPDIARSEVRAGANLLVNLTNDAWYGRSSAPYQSLAMAVFRAVENKRSLLRAANTGISALVEPSGKIIVRSQIFVPAVLRGKVPVLEQQTVFVRGGYMFGTICLAMVPVLLIRRKYFL